MNDIMDRLQAPFAEADYEWRVQSEVSKGAKVRVLCYVTARAIQDRLDNTVGPFGWRVAYRAGPDGGVVCELSIRDPDTKEWVSKEDGAENTDIAAVKGGISGAMKRAGVAWGIGRLLYGLTGSCVPLQDRGEHYHKRKADGVARYWNAPRLPQWAVAGKVAERPQGSPVAQPAPDQPPPDSGNGEDKKFFAETTVAMLKRDPLAQRDPTPDEMRWLAKEATTRSNTGNYRDAAIWLRDHCVIGVGTDGQINATWQNNKEQKCPATTR